MINHYKPLLTIIDHYLHFFNHYNYEPLLTIIYNFKPLWTIIDHYFQALTIMNNYLQS